MICSINEKRAKQVANNLVTNLYTGFLISKSIEADFKAILQPTFVNSNSYPPLKDEGQKLRAKNYKNQFDKVYPFILDKVASICIKDSDFCDSFIDGTKWLNNIKEPIFIDECYLTERGNAIIAQKIIKAFNF